MRISGLAAGLGMLLVSGAGPGAAQSSPKVESFGDLIGLCRATDDTTATAFCDGFILGNGMLYAALRQAEVVDRWACADPIPTLSEIRAAVVAWAAANPQHGGDKAIDGLWRAASAIYPCS